MLKWIDGNQAEIIDQDDYAIEEKEDGKDQLTLTLPRGHPAWTKIREESIIQEEQPYVVKQITSDATSMDITAELDLDDWKATLLEHVRLRENTLLQMVQYCLPSGWSITDKTTGTTGYDDLNHDGGTPLEVLDSIKETWGILCRFDPTAKVITLYNEDYGSNVGVYLTQELNLRSVNYTGSSDSFCTRLYCYGKGGMDFSDINGGKAYIEDHTYSDKTIVARWQDTSIRRSDKLLEAGRKELARRCMPQASYECDVVDLAKAHELETGDRYNFLKFSLFSIVTLLDTEHKTRIQHRIVSYKRYPNYPEKNSVTLATLPPDIKDDIQHAQDKADDAEITANDALDNSQTAMDTANALEVRVEQVEDGLQSTVKRGDVATIIKQSPDAVLSAFQDATSTWVVRSTGTGQQFFYNGLSIGRMGVQTGQSSYGSDYWMTIKSDISTAGVCFRGAGSYGSLYLNFNSGGSDDGYNMILLGSAKIDGAISSDSIISTSANIYAGTVCKAENHFTCGYDDGATGTINLQMPSFAGSGTRSLRFNGGLFVECTDTTNLSAYATEAIGIITGQEVGAGQEAELVQAQNILMPESSEAGTLEDAKALRAKIESVASNLTDEQARTLEATNLFPVWQGDGRAYTAGDRVRYMSDDGVMRLYKCIKDHTSRADARPDADSTLWEVVVE